ncbi:MAG: NAD-glutamate dehydrogenase, partial [Deltaproteobacteria bacterium]|nr:NAD-glutamate dehydrogenase [Deltaproteobacteria bacterium]
DDLLPLAVKIDCKTVDHMPLPRPMYEIYVHGAEVEGIHLRGAKIARGGIRHSDRPDDFRTEILGLMKTQMMKNVVIVPEGSKGGFVPKKQVFSRKETLEEGKKQYKKFISALLSLTDNVIDGKVQSPDNLIIYDESDPYLVVAADKGTAHLSDTANEISEQHGFWLKDAFASGGKNGYDHKKIGITARGAWECVKLHFLELGKDIQKEPFRVVGIGDMAGDVFGNGMLLSDCIMLVGAFNHIHIFVDPNPDPKLSFAERQRLFTMPGSTWMDYDKKLISQGGGVFERSAKSILLSPKLKELLGTEIDEVNGEELIRLLMLCDADLLWNGGIGTYIKATTETSHQVGDPTNDMVRVNAEDLKFKVIGEGGNLGLTQKARIEFNINGGKINTDAIDNSGGVGISDREVNLKILLFEMLRLNIIKNIDERNQLMDDVSPEITRLTLKDNRQQSQIISMDNLRSKKNIRPFIDLIQYLSKIQLLDRRTENITNNNLLNQYAEKGIGVPRPDLAVLLSYTKMYFYKEIIKSKVLDDPNLDKIFMDYFPKQIFIKTKTTKIEHPLKREIIGTMLVNRTINQSGISILPIINNILGASSTEIIIVHSVLTHAFNFPLLREKIIKTIKTKDVHLAYQLLIKIENFILMNMIWVLVRYPSGDISFSLVEPFTRALNEYKEFFDKTLDDYDKAEYEVMLKNLIDSGVNEEIGIDIVQLEFIDDNLELAIMVEDTKLALSDLIGISKALEKDLHYKALKNHLFKLDPTSEWAIKHRGVLIKQLQFIKQSIFRYIVTQYHDFDSFQSGYEIFLNENSGDIRNYNVEFNDFIRTENIDLNGAAVLINTATNIINKMIDISRQQ